jgi:hypothetical protein
VTPRRFPPPWTVEDKDACFIVRDNNGQALAYVYSRMSRAADQRHTCSRATTRDVSRRTWRSFQSC